MSHPTSEPTRDPLSDQPDTPADSAVAEVAAVPTDTEHDAGIPTCPGSESAGQDSAGQDSAGQESTGQNSADRESAGDADEDEELPAPDPRHVELLGWAITAALAGDDKALAAACHQALEGDLTEVLARLIGVVSLIHDAYLPTFSAVDDVDLLGSSELAIRCLEALSPPRPDTPNFYQLAAVRLYAAAIHETDETDFGIGLGDTLALLVLLAAGQLHLATPGRERDTLTAALYDPGQFRPGSPALAPDPDPGRAAPRYALPDDERSDPAL